MNTATQEVSSAKPSALYGTVGRDNVAPAMLKLVVREVAEKEGITNAKELSERAGLHYESCRLIWYGKSRRIDLDTLEKLCDALHVRPGQLFEYEPGAVMKEPPVETKGKRKS